MTRAKLSKLMYICLLSIPTILIIVFFFLRDLVSKHHEIHHLFFSSYKFVIGEKSSRVVVFAVLNVIIITVFLRSSKPSSAVDFDEVFFLHYPPPGVHEEYSKEREKDNDEGYDSQDDKEHDEYHGYDGYDEDNDDDLDEEDVHSEDEIADVDLERRIEEFISNAHKKWGEELRAENLLVL